MRYVSAKKMETKLNVSNVQKNTKKTDAWQIKDSYGWYTWYGPYFEVPSSIQKCDNIHVNVFSGLLSFPVDEWENV